MSAENTNYVNYLIDLSQRGRRNAFFDLCEINLRSIFTLVFRLTANYQLSKDITLKTFQEAFDKIKTYNNSDPFALWLMNIAIKHSIQMMNEIDFVDKDIYDKRNDLGKIEQLIINLPPLERVIFVLHDLAGFNIKEIARHFHGYLEDDIKTKLIETRNNLIVGLSL